METQEDNGEYFVEIHLLYCQSALTCNLIKQLRDELQIILTTT